MHDEVVDRPVITVQYLDELGMARRRYGKNFKAVQNPMHIVTTIDDEHVVVAECQSCHLALLGLAKCSRCKTVYYCGEACQRKDWPAHKQLCGRTGQ